MVILVTFAGTSALIWYNSTATEISPGEDFQKAPEGEAEAQTTDSETTQTPAPPAAN